MLGELFEAISNDKEKPIWAFKGPRLIRQLKLHSNE